MPNEFNATRFHNRDSIACNMRNAKPHIAMSLPSFVSMTNGASARQIAPIQPSLAISFLLMSIHYWMLISKAEREAADAPSKPSRDSPSSAFSIAETKSFLVDLAEATFASGFW